MSINNIYSMAGHPQWKKAGGEERNKQYLENKWRNENHNENNEGVASKLSTMA
jgi:hypothetical protein